MDDRGSIPDCGGLTWCYLLRRDNLVIEGENPGCLPGLQDELGGEHAEVGCSKNLCKVVLSDTTKVLCFKHSNFLCPDLFEWHKTNDVKTLKKVCAVGRVDEDVDVELPCLTEQA